MRNRSTEHPFFTTGAGWFFLSLLSALLLILTFPQPGFSFLAWVALVPLFLILTTSSLKKTLLAALVTGVLFNTIYLYWMKEYKHPLALSGGVFGEMVFFILMLVIGWVFAWRKGFLKWD